MAEFTVWDQDGILSVTSALHDALDEGKRVVVKLTDKRSLDANAQVWVWVPQIAKFMGWTIPETAAELKLDHGLPIILADQEYGPKTMFILKRCDFWAMPREQQLGLVDFLPVTRLFSTKQHNAYRDSIQVHFVKQGLNLEYLND
ncbi:hypothetical protein [Vibrio harveyi]|uniref:hypothetical protein n=1 Tax=Vibrio harveyi TaxID=669 RepID=UPI00217DB441|nr:hypothetical protein [Vibrio harveyi]